MPRPSRSPSRRRVPATGRVSKEPRRTVGEIAISNGRTTRANCQRGRSIAVTHEGRLRQKTGGICRFQRLKAAAAALASSVMNSRHLIWPLTRSPRWDRVVSMAPISITQSRHWCRESRRVGCPLLGLGKAGIQRRALQRHLLKTADEPVEARDHLPSLGPALSKCVHPSRPRRLKKFRAYASPLQTPQRPIHTAGPPMTREATMQERLPCGRGQLRPPLYAARFCAVLVYPMQFSSACRRLGL
jgi:hypothetical protein